MNKQTEPIVVEQIFEAAIDTVWNSITEIDLMRQWYFEAIPSFKPEVGFETQFNVESQGRNFLHLWKVTEVLPLKKIAYRWRYEGYRGDSVVMFELSTQGNHTHLKLTHSILESFPDDIPEFERESGIGGWEFFIQKSLREFLDKTE